MSGTTPSCACSKVDERLLEEPEGGGEEGRIKAGSDALVCIWESSLAAFLFWRLPAMKMTEKAD